MMDQLGAGGVGNSPGAGQSLWGWHWSGFCNVL